MKKKLVTKTFHIEDQKIVSEDGKIYLVGYANTKGHADSHGDIPTSLDGEPVYDVERMLTNPVCFVDHYASASNIAGNFVELEEDERGLKIKLLFRSLDKIFNDNVKDAVSAWIEGFGRALSIGGYWIHGDKDNAAHLTKAIIHEISLVGIGSDAEALLDSAYPKGHESKSAVPYQDLALADRSMFWNPVAAIGRVREWAGAEDGGLEDPEVQRKYQKAFLYVDRRDADSFDAYQLPIADVIDGNLVAVPRGIFAAAGAMRGGRGGVYLPRQDMPSVVRNIERYYEKMGLETPFNEKASFRLDDFLSVDEKELETMLKDGVSFSSKQAKAMVSAIKSAGLRDEESAGNRDGDEDLDGLKEALGDCLTKINNQEG